MPHYKIVEEFPYGKVVKRFMMVVFSQWLAMSE
jgi:hypothetical protein